MDLTLPQVGGRVSAQLAHTLQRNIELAPPSLLTYFATKIDGVDVLDRVLVDGVEVERAQAS